jgi:glycosyltransferase involved in cell wall biosynthesis
MPDISNNLSVLVVEPYYGGSHKSVLDGLSRLPFNFELMTLPPRKWKWRMRVSAPYFADKLHKLGKRYDRILCSTYLDVAAFRSLAPAWVREVPLLTYFHENQFAYPVQKEDARDIHFALTNMTTALASDGLAFNSTYNLESFLTGMEDLLKHSTDMDLSDLSGAIRQKSRVIHPGIDFSDIDAEKKPEREDVPLILWNHRWEHDKNPEGFFEMLYDIDDEGVDFGVVVLGESFERQPPVFSDARERLSHRIRHFGYAGTRREYVKWLKRGDIAVSTAGHEFFGIAVIEAVRAGCRPLLPKRLSYPELFPEEFLYEDGDFKRRLKDETARSERLSEDEALRLTESFSWDVLAPVYETWIKYASVTTP